MGKERTRKIALYLSYIAQVMFEDAGEKWKPIFSEDEMKEAKLRAEMLQAQIHMTVARLGGNVEGQPTSELNFLQRVDELVRLERKNQEALTVLQAITGSDNRENPWLGIASAVQLLKMGAQDESPDIFMVTFYGVYPSESFHQDCVAMFADQEQAIKFADDPDRGCDYVVLETAVTAEVTDEAARRIGE